MEALISLLLRGALFGFISAGVAGLLFFIWEEKRPLLKRLSFPALEMSANYGLVGGH